MNEVFEIIINSILSIVAIIITIVIQICSSCRHKKEITISAINELQENVFDKLVHVDNKNAKMIVENICDDEDCKTAYNDYRVIIARLDQFAVAVKNNVYSYHIVKNMIGTHLAQIKSKILPIIDETNIRGSSNNYANYLWLVQRLENEAKVKE